MSRYIDAEELEDELYEHEFSNWCDKDEVSELIDNMPTADVVEVVRCKDCKFNKGKNKCLNEHSIIDIPKDTDYCSYGKRGRMRTLQEIALELLNKYQKAKTNNIIKQSGATTKKLWTLEQECSEIYGEIMESGEQENERKQEEDR